MKSPLVNLPRARSLIHRLTIKNKFIAALRRGLRYGELHVDPGHFYSPIPSIDTIKDRERTIFSKRSDAPGVDLRVREQGELLRALSPLIREYPFPRERDPRYRYYWQNGFFERVDGMMLYSILRHLTPNRVVEVGCGYSSALMLDVNELYLGGHTHFTFIDPNPERLLERAKPKDFHSIDLRRIEVQDAPLGLFTELRSGDILFIDSSHVTKVASDVNHLFFDVLPRLAPGVWIHIHDVFYPFEYPRDWLLKGWAWNEAYFVRAFMQYNAAFEITLFVSFLRREAPDLLLPLLPEDWQGLDWELGSSLWIRRRDVTS